MKGDFNMTQNPTVCAEVAAKEKELDAIVTKYKDTRGKLIPILHEAQELFGYLPMEVQLAISKKSGIPLAEIYGVVSFYAQFSIYPKGDNKISVCMGTACYVKGAANVLDEIKTELGIEVGQCTEDRKFSLDACRCVGSCGLAPVVTINEDVYGKLTPEDIPDILAKY